jgi:hypothetical protein
MGDKCEYCNRSIKPNCDWHQGRCPHTPSLMDEIIRNSYKTRFYNLIKLFGLRK